MPVTFDTFEDFEKMIEPTFRKIRADNKALSEENKKLKTELAIRKEMYDY